MKTTQKIAAIVLVALLSASVYGFFLTGRSVHVPARNTKIAPVGAADGPIVDQTPLWTAQRLAKMPTTAEEKPFAEEALRLADHEMDLTYAAAEREAEDHPPTLSAEAKAIEERLKKSEDALDADNDLVEQLTAAEAKASGAKKDALHDQLILATAHREEHQDEVDDAKGDLERAGGDPKGRIEAMMQEHKASSQATDALHGDQLTGPRARIPERVENCNARAHERTRFLSGQFIRNRSQSRRWRNNVLGVPTVEVKPGDLSIDAHGEITAPAQLAYETVSAMPADADALTFLPGRNTVTECIDVSCDFMTRHTGILKPGPETFLDQRIAMANAARFDFHAHLPNSWLGNIAFD